MHRYVYADVDTTETSVVRGQYQRPVELTLADCGCMYTGASAGADDGASVGALLRYAERLICSFTDLSEALH